MPRQFEQCIKKGGKVITKKIDKKRYIHICYLGKKSFAGEVKTKKTK